MATKFQFGNKTIKEPGVYTKIESGIKNLPLGLSYGNALIIDTGLGAGYGLGAGVDGELSKNKDSIYSFSDIKDFRAFVRGGIFWDIAQWLFKPSKNPNVNGVSNLFFVKAATTTAASIDWLFGDTSVSLSGALPLGGSLKVQCKSEGLVGNGTLTSTVLTRGFASKMRAGKVNTSKYIFDFYGGTFKGLDSDGDAYGNIKEVDSKPELLASSKEVATVGELVEWMKTDYYFNLYFKYISSDEWTFDAGDLAAYTSYNLAAGGTENYSSANLDSVLENIAELDFQFILADKYGKTNGKHAYNDTILTSLVNSKYGIFLVIGGGKDLNEFNVTDGSIEIAEHFDSENVLVVHAGIKKTKTTGGGYKEYDSLYKAAAVLGRIAGLAPQIPGTFKDIDMDADMHDMKKIDRERALDAGVLHTKYEESFGKFIINQSISSLQKNDNMVNEDATTCEVSIKRIAAQLQKEIYYNVKVSLLQTEKGVNRNSLSPAVMTEYIRNYLQTKQATPQVDNLILTFRNITVKILQDAYFVEFEYEPNFPVNKIFVTGIMIDTTSNP